MSPGEGGGTKIGQFRRVRREPNQLSLHLLWYSSHFPFTGQGARLCSCERGAGTTEFLEKGGGGMMSVGEGVKENNDQYYSRRGGERIAVGEVGKMMTSISRKGEKRKWWKLTVEKEEKRKWWQVLIEEGEEEMMRITSRGRRRWRKGRKCKI